MNTVIAEEEKRELKDIVAFIRSELKPKGKLLTPFNLISAPIILLGVLLILYRLARGMGAVTNLSQEFPWGIWIGFDVMVGVAFAGGGVCPDLRGLYPPLGEISFHHQGNRFKRPPGLCLLCRSHFPGSRSLVEYHKSALGKQVRGEFRALPHCLALLALYAGRVC